MRIQNRFGLDARLCLTCLVQLNGARREPTTGTLARLSAKIAALVCGASAAAVDAIGRFAEAIGVAFQIQDDILNLVGEKFGDLKGEAKSEVEPLSE